MKEGFIFFATALGVALGILVILLFVIVYFPYLFPNPLANESDERERRESVENLAFRVWVFRLGTFSHGLMLSCSSLRRKLAERL